MKAIVTRVLQLAFLLSIASGSLAAEIEGTCMVSFSVVDRSFVSGATAMSCTALESRRMSLFAQVSSLPKSGSLNISATMKALADLEDRLKKLETDADWTGLATSISGDTLATLSFATCIESSGGGCAAPAVGRLLSLVGTANGRMSDAQKATEVSSMRAAIAATRVKIQDATPPIAIVRDRLVLESNRICAEIRQNCL